MNKYIKAAIVLVPVLTMSGCFPPGGGKALAADKVCMTMEQDEFLDVQKEYIKKGVYATPEELKIFVDSLNIDRVKNKVFLLEADTMFVATLDGGRVGLVIFKDKCIVAGLAIAMDYDSMYAFLKGYNSHNILNRLADGV